MESFFSTLKTERTARKVYQTRNESRADVFNYIERFYNPRYASLILCPQNRQQLTLVDDATKFAIDHVEEMLVSGQDYETDEPKI